MITIYTLDGLNVFAGQQQVDPYAAVPLSTLTAPPETTGAQVAQFVAGEWVVLPEYPSPAPPPPPALASARTREDVLADLATIDAKSIRALREGNDTRIAELETQAQALRTELASL